MDQLRGLESLLTNYETDPWDCNLHFPCHWVASVSLTDHTNLQTNEIGFRSYYNENYRVMYSVNGIWWFFLAFFILCSGRPCRLFAQ